VIEIADEKSGVPKLRLTLTDVMIESFSANANGGFGGGQSETFTLNFAAAQWNHNPVAEESVGQMLQTSSYSLELARGH
jgi:type VI protein secretion system component Hcp